MSEETRVAEYYAADEETVARLVAGLPRENTLYDLAELFRVFGDSTRIKILYALFESELCVGDIDRVLGLSSSLVSHQLRILKANRLVRSRRKGKAIFYSLDDDHVASIVSLGVEHVREKDQILYHKGEKK